MEPASVDTAPVVAGCAAAESVDTSPEMAGFATCVAGRPGPRTASPRRLQIGADRLAAAPGHLFDAPERPSQAPKRQDLLSLLKTLLIPAKDHVVLAGVNVSVAAR